MAYDADGREDPVHGDARVPALRAGTATDRQAACVAIRDDVQNAAELPVVCHCPMIRADARYALVTGTLDGRRVAALRPVRVRPAPRARPADPHRPSQLLAIGR